MKIILFKNVIHRGKRYGVGETLDLAEAVAERFISDGLAHYAAPENADAQEQGEGENIAPADTQGEEIADAQEQKTKTKKGKAAKK